MTETELAKPLKIVLIYYILFIIICIILFIERRYKTMMYHEIQIYTEYTEEQLKLIYNFIQDQYESALDDYDAMENNTLYEAGHEREVIHNLQDQTKLICLLQSIKDQLMELIIVDKEGGEKNG